MVMDSPTLCFIGGGNMATSLIGGLIANHYDPAKIRVSDPNTEKLEALQKRFGIEISSNNVEAVSQTEIVIVAVKPQQVHMVGLELQDTLQENRPLIVSIAAGVSTLQLAKWFGKLAIIRAMPNTPALLKAGASALFANSLATDPQKDLAESLLRAVGTTVWVPHEKDIDTVTALSGSGPAYFFMIMEILENSGYMQGLTHETARLLVAQTALGAARMALESSIDIGALRQQVTSPNGTTAKAIEILEDGGLRNLLDEAVVAAKHRAMELSTLLDQET